MDKEAKSLEQLLDQIDQTTEKKEDQVSLDEILDAVGRRSFGPLLLIAGLITVAPIIGDIPGVPTIMGIFVLLVGGQLLFHQEHFWLPEWLLEQSLRKGKVFKGLKWMRTPARFLDRWLHRRLPIFIQGTAIYMIALMCMAIALAMPVMEIIPFSANIAGVALTAFGLSLISHDGLISLIAFIFAVGTFALIIYSLL